MRKTDKELGKKITSYFDLCKKLNKRKLSNNQFLFEKTLLLERIFHPFFLRRFKEISVNLSETENEDDIRFQPAVLQFLLKDVLDKLFLLREFSESISFNKELAFFNSEIRRIENESRRIPRIFLNKIPKNLHLSKKPAISIITPSFNHGRFLEDTIRSITSQTYKKYEHIVIDGGSNDETIRILKRYRHIRWVSEKDTGYNEAFKKGLLMAKGEYIMTCAVSDAYANINWFKKCVEILDSQKDISLVWGFPQYLSETGDPRNVSFSQFYFTPFPSKFNFFYLWLITGRGFPEGNICVRKTVLEKCLLGYDHRPSECEIWKELNFHFNEEGFLSCHIPIIANFGRTHKGQLGERDRVIGMKLLRKYKNKINLYRWMIVLGIKKHNFRDGYGNVLPPKFSTRRYAFELFQNLITRVLVQKNRFLFRIK